MLLPTDLSFEEIQKIDILRNLLGQRRFFLELKKEQNYLIKRLVECLVIKYPEAKAYLEEYLLSEKVYEKDIHENRVHFCIANVLLKTELEKVKSDVYEINERYMLIFSIYIKRGIDYLSAMYDLSQINETNYIILDKEERYLFLLNTIQESIKKGNTENPLKTIHDAAKAYPNLQLFHDKYVQDFLKLKY